MKTLLNIAFLLTISLVFAQEKNITGVVKSSADHTNLAYVSIGVLKKSMGTISNEDGSFSMKTNMQISPKDLVRFSLIGYKDYMISIIELENKKNIIYLEPDPTILEEIVVTKKHNLHYKLGNQSQGKMFFKYYSIHDTTIDDNLGREQGVILDIKNDISIDQLHFDIACNDFKNIKFRLKFYQIENDKPTTLINLEDIIFDVKDGQKGLFTVDLQNFNIVVKNKQQIGVGLEWIHAMSENKNTSCFGITYKGSKNRKGLFRDKSEANWTIMKQEPVIFLDVTEIE